MTDFFTRKGSKQERMKERKRRVMKDLVKDKG